MRIENRQLVFHYIIPQYDEIALFAMSLTCVLLLAAAFLSGPVELTFDAERDFDPRAVAAAFVFLAGLVLSIYHAFTDRPKKPIEKTFMLFFAVVLNSFSGILAGMYELSVAHGWTVVFPIVNIGNSAVLFFMYRTGVLDEANISDRHASRSQFLLTAAVVLLLFALCRYVFALIWMQTLSICVAYATNLGRSVPLWILGEQTADRVRPEV